MARVINPLLSVEARGSVSGLQFSRTRAGAHCGRKSTSTRSQAPGAVEHRATLAPAQSAWAALTHAQQAAWSTYAPHPLTGQAAYIQHHLRARAISIRPQSTPTAPAAPTTLGGWLWLSEDWLAGYWFPLFAFEGNGANYVHARTWQSFHLTAAPHDRKIKAQATVDASSGAIDFTILPAIPYTWIWLHVVDELMAQTLYTYRFVYDRGVQIPELTQDQ